MKRLIQEELNRVRQIMGVIHEQERDIITQDGKRFERIVSDVPPYESDNWRAEFASGKFSAGDLEGSPELSGLVEWLNDPRLLNTKIVVAVTAGTSKVPVKPGGVVAKALQAIGKTPNNEGLAIARGETAVEMVKNQLRTLIPEEIFNNIEFTVDLSKVEQGPEWDEVDATAKKYTDHQFLTTYAFATGQEETLSELPEICSGGMNGSGGQASRKTKGPTGLPFAVYKKNPGGDGYLGKRYDLGVETIGTITFEFNAIRIPDMFQITYNNQTFTSSGPGGEGFVSNSFKTCEEGSACYNSYMKKIDKLRKKTGKQKKKLEKAEVKTGKLNINSWRMLIGSHGYEPGVDIATNKKIDREWILKFWEKYEPGSYGKFSKMFKDKKRKKYNPAFTDGWSTYEEDEEGNWIKKKNAKPVKGKDVWEEINNIWILLDDVVEDLQKQLDKASTEDEKEIIRLEAELQELMDKGNPNDYAKSMTRRLKRIGFDQGVIGTNGSITFEKVKGVGEMYLQVYAPLDDTVWHASVDCGGLS